MGGQSNGYQSQPMQSWGYGGGYGGSGSGGGYGMGNYRQPMYGQQSNQYYGGNQYGNPFSQFMQQWPQFGQQYMGGQQLYGNPGGMGVMGGNMINPSGVGDPSQNYRQQIRLQAGPQYETTGIVPPGGMTQNTGQLDYAEQQQPFGGGF